MRRLGVCLVNEGRCVVVGVTRVPFLVATAPGLNEQHGILAYSLSYTVGISRRL
jgi:hypothetical protein